MQAEITLEMDCDLSGAAWFCAQFDHPVIYDPSPFGALTNKLPAGVRVLSMREFTDSLTHLYLSVGSNGQVTEWLMQGAELWTDAGDFRLSSQMGDSWSWGGQDLEYASAYCWHEHGQLFINGPLQCADGTSVPQPVRTTALGDGGDWRMVLSAAVLPIEIAAAPLPAGLPLCLSVTGVLGLMRCRSRRH